MKNMNKVRDMKNMEMRRVVGFLNKEDAMEFLKYVFILDPEFEEGETYVKNENGELETRPAYYIKFKLNNEKMKIIVDKFDLWNGNRFEKHTAINRVYWVKRA